MLGHRELSLDDYLAMLRRRWWVIAIPAVLGPIIAFGISLKIPSRYTSQTLVLVEQQKVPSSYVTSIVTEDINARLGTMREQILSRTRLQPIIERFGLFKDEGGQRSMEDLVAQMRKDVSVTAVQPVMGSKEGELAGFYIAFTSDNPHLAQQVCQEITSMFIDENLRLREQSAQGTTSFLESQLDDAKRKLDEQDSRLAQFKSKYMGDLPDEALANMNVLGSLGTQLQAATQALNAAQRDKFYWQSILAQQVEAWERTKNEGAKPETLAEQIAGYENQLLQLRSRYTEDHPDILKMKALIADLKQKAKENETESKNKPVDKVEKAEKASVPEPAQIQQLRVQLKLYDRTIAEATRDQSQIQQQIRSVQSRLQLSPAIEQEYKKLTRDYQTALEFYNDLLRKKSQSAMATDLERRQQGEQFRVMDPPNLPEHPSYPDRPMFALAGFGGGLALGFLIALLLELRDKALRTETDIEFYLSLPTLTAVPTIGGDERRKGSLAARNGNRKPAAEPVEV